MMRKYLTVFSVVKKSFLVSLFCLWGLLITLSAGPAWQSIVIFVIGLVALALHQNNYPQSKWRWFAIPQAFFVLLRSHQLFDLLETVTDLMMLWPVVKIIYLIVMLWLVFVIFWPTKNVFLKKNDTVFKKHSVKTINKLGVYLSVLYLLFYTLCFGKVTVMHFVKLALMPCLAQDGLMSFSKHGLGYQLVLPSEIKELPTNSTTGQVKYSCGYVEGEQYFAYYPIALVDKNKAILEMQHYFEDKGYEFERSLFNSSEDSSIILFKPGHARVKLSFFNDKQQVFLAISYSATTDTILKQEPENLQIIIFSPKFLLGETMEDVDEKIKLSPPSGDVIQTALSERDIIRFRYGRIDLTPVASKKIQEVRHGSRFVIYLDNTFVLSGNVEPGYTALAPKGTVLTNALVTDSNLVGAAIFIDDHFDTDFHKSTAIRKLQDYFFSIGKATESWQEKPTPY